MTSSSPAPYPSVEGETLAAQTQHLAGLCSGGYLQSGTTRDGGHLYRTAECGGGEVEHQVIHDIVAVTYEFGMFHLLDYNQQVAVGSAVGCRVALAAHGESLTVLHAGGDGERHSLLLAHNALAVTVCTLLGDDFALAVTLRTLHGRLRDAKHGLLLAYHRARAVTGGTGVKRCAVLGSGAVTVWIGHKGGYLESLGDAGGYLGQGHLDFDAEVGAATLAAACAAAGRLEAAHIAERAPENIAKLREYILHRESSRMEASRAAGESLRTHIVAKLVILGSLVGIGKHVISLGGLLEFLFGFLIARILVGVILYGLLAIGTLDGFLVGISVDAKHPRNNLF